MAEEVKTTALSTAASGGSPTSTPPVPPLKPGYRCSEMWLAAGQVIAALLVAVLHWSDGAVDAFVRGWASLGALAASTSVVVAYVLSRHGLKQAHVEAHVEQKKNGGRPPSCDVDETTIRPNPKAENRNRD